MDKREVRVWAFERAVDLVLRRSDETNEERFARVVETAEVLAAYAEGPPAPPVSAA